MRMRVGGRMHAGKEGMEWKEGRKDGRMDGWTDGPSGVFV